MTGLCSLTISNAAANIPVSGISGPFQNDCAHHFGNPIRGTADRQRGFQGLYDSAPRADEGPQRGVESRRHPYRVPVK